VLREWEHDLKSIRSPAQRSFIATLREAREAAGLTQKEVAKKLKRPQSFVSAYESGDRKIDVLEFIRIARAVGMEPSELLRRLT
jgi:transcriptional regulator with XRE-family HTH domain